MYQEVPIFSWTGGYIGLQGGGLWSDSNVDNLDTDLFDGDRDGFGDSFNGGLFGVYAGYNWQSGPWVFGAEGDFNGVWNDETFNILGQDVDVGSDYLASLRGRVGYAFDRTLIFATGGVAFTQFSAEADFGNNVSFNADQNFTGWTVGAGAEYAFTNNWIGRSNTAIMTSATMCSTASPTSGSRPTHSQSVSPTSSDRQATKKWPGHCLGHFMLVVAWLTI